MSEAVFKSFWRREFWLSAFLYSYTIIQTPILTYITYFLLHLLLYYLFFLPRRNFKIYFLEIQQTSFLTALSSLDICLFCNGTVEFIHALSSCHNIAN